MELFQLSQFAERRGMTGIFHSDYQRLPKNPNLPAVTHSIVSRLCERFRFESSFGFLSASRARRGSRGIDGHSDDFGRWCPDAKVSSITGWCLSLEEGGGGESNVCTLADKEIWGGSDGFQDQFLHAGQPWQLVLNHKAAMPSRFGVSSCAGGCANLLWPSQQDWILHNWTCRFTFQIGVSDIHALLPGLTCLFHAILLSGKLWAL